MTSLYRVKPYAHHEYKFVVRAKVDGSWKRRYFRTEEEANAFANEQNGVLGEPTKNLSGTSAESAASSALPWTGERLVTTCQRPLAYEHLHRYAIACGLARDKRVLDIACGEGYGANLLANYATQVTGVDIAADAIAHATARYSRPNLQFLTGDCTAIPVADHSVDLVASFETIEHLENHAAFLREIERVLAPGGVLVISSPDKAAYANASAAPNPFHLRELTHRDFGDLLRHNFKHCVMAKQRLVVGSWTAPDDVVDNLAAATFDGSFDHLEIERGVARGVYSMAVCSNDPLPLINFGVFEQFKESAETWHLLDRYNSAADVAMRVSALEHEVEARVREIAQAQAESAGLTQRLAVLQQEHEEKNASLVEQQRAQQQLVQQTEALQRQNTARSQRLTVLRRKHEVRGLELLSLQQTRRDQATQIRQLQDRIDSNAAEAALRQRAIEGLQTELKQVRALLETTQREIVAAHGALDEGTNEKAALQLQLDRALEETTRNAAALVDARWDVLTLRADAIRRTDASADAVLKLTEMENLANSAASERDQLRSIVVALQTDLEQERLNVRAMQQRAGFAEERAELAERTADLAREQSRAAEGQFAEIAALKERLYSTEDRFAATERRVAVAESRAAASEAQLATVQAQSEATQQQLRTTAQELASRRKQILALRDQLARRLILPFGKSQQHLYELTR